MMHPFVKYSDGTEVVFTDIIKNEKGEETIQIHFERPTEHGFDSVRFDLPSYKFYIKMETIQMKKSKYLEQL